MLSPNFFQYTISLKYYIYFCFINLWRNVPHRLLQAPRLFFGSGPDTFCWGSAAADLSLRSFCQCVASSSSGDSDI